jgi:2-phospho-L-lactate guanylyltransferase
MAYRALIPVKTLREAKSRLAPYLTETQRAMLVLDMLRHVINVLQASKSLETISVVSPDPHVLQQVQAWGARALVEEAQGHNPALTAAAQKEQVSGATALLTLSADLPMLQAYDIQHMIEQSHHHQIVLAPSYEGTGTNALLVRPPLAVPYVFGPGSLQRYQAVAQQRHLSNTLYTSRGTTFDVDTINDVNLFRCYEEEQITATSPFGY